MEGAIGLFIGLGITVMFLALGLFVGGRTERVHFESIRRRETELKGMLVTQIKTFPHAVPGGSAPKMITAEAVIATDYLKTFLAGLRNLFGGHVGSYQRMLERARREATLRVLDQARSLGYSAVCNLRLETADVGGNNVAQKMPMAAILATGTAYHARVTPP